MVKTDLTTEMIVAGRRLLEAFDRGGFRAPACYWFYFPESDRWRFVVASPEVRTRGPHAVYRKVQTLARKVPDVANVFGPSDVTVVADKDPLVTLLRSVVAIPGIGGVRITNSSINGTLIDDAYIYRLT